MDKYTEFKETLDKKYILGEDVEPSEGIISIYDLVLMLQEAFEELRDVKKADWFKSLINEDRTIIQKINFWKKKKIVDQECTSIISTFSKAKCRISFGFEDRRSKSGHKFVVLMKDRDSDALYFETDYFADKEFADKYISEIYAMFDTLEDYAELYPVDDEGKVISLKQTFDDGFLSVIVEVYLSGEVHCTILPSKSADPEKIYDREWLSRIKLSSYVKENNVDILHSIPVRVDSLNESFRSIVQKGQEKKTQTKGLIKARNDVSN